MFLEGWLLWYASTFYKTLELTIHFINVVIWNVLTSNNNENNEAGKNHSSEND